MKTTSRRKKKSELEHDHLFRGAFSLKPIVRAHLLDALLPEQVAVLDLDSLDLAVLTVKLEAKTGVDVFANGIVSTVGEILCQIDER